MRLKLLDYPPITFVKINKKDMDNNFDKIGDKPFSIEIEITDGVSPQTRRLKGIVSTNTAVTLLHKLYEEDYLSLTYNLWINNEIYLSLEQEIKMNAKDQAKLAKAGYVIIRRQDAPEPHIKYKSSNNPDSWKKLPEKFKSKAERDRHANRLLEQTLIIED